MTIAAVNMWGRRIGAVNLASGARFAVFEYDPEFARSQIEVAPLQMPLGAGRFQFNALNPESFHGLPGLLADSLPDRYGNALIDAWLAGQGRTPDSFDAVERLCYIGTRGMGALEFEPAQGPTVPPSETLHVSRLVELASKILAHREELVVSLADGEEEAGMREILSVGTSAGGARAKAVIAWNPHTQEVRSGQVDTAEGFEHWLLKFDGVEGNRDRDRLADPQGYGAIEFAYSLMAADAQITMSSARLFEENGRRHFMTRRFDRAADGAKIHMQSLAALAHLDYSIPDVHSYEQAFLVLRQLDLGADDAEQLFRRMTFNVVARNQDDHVKNISFLMDRSGRWHLAPAFDVIYSYRPDSRWVSQHQMSVNGKRDGFVIADFEQCARTAGLKQGAAKRILGEVTDVVSQWRDYAGRADVDERHVDAIQGALRLAIPRS